MGIGSFTTGDIPEITGDRTYNMIDGRFDTSSDIAKEAYNKAMIWLERLLSVELLQSGIGDVITYWIRHPIMKYSDVDNPLKHINIPDPPSEPNLRTVSFPSMPDRPGGYSSTRQEYSSTLVTRLLTKLISDVTNGSTGLGADVEDDLYARAKARRELDNEQKIAKIIAANSSLGWSKPPGSLAAGLRSAETEIYRDTQMMNYEIIINQAEWIQKNKEMVYRTSVELEKSLMEYILRSEDTGIKVYSADVEAYKSIIQGVLGEMEVQNTYNKGQVDVYSEMVKARALICDIRSKAIDMEIKQSIASVDVNIKELDAKIRALVETYGTEKNIVQGAAQVASQLCAAALGSVNVGAAMQYQEQRSDARQAQVSLESRETDDYSVVYEYIQNTSND